ncbi:PaaI family thioesterase [Reichenbachiella faecimaris]|nr:PaaI family thioesterase [Reichenbachiella faecimaris]
MKTLGAQLENIDRGEVSISCSLNEGVSQQNGFFHAGVLVSICDSACGYAALTTMPLEADVLSVEFKINLLRPSNCDQILAVGTVLKAGKTLTICEGEVKDKDSGKLLAKMTATMISIQKNG